MEEIRESIRNKRISQAHMDNYFLPKGILYNRQQEALEEAENPLGLIGRIFQTKLEEENSDIALQQKFEGTFYRNAVDHQIKCT